MNDHIDGAHNIWAWEANLERKWPLFAPPPAQDIVNAHDFTPTKKRHQCWHHLNLFGGFWWAPLQLPLLFFAFKIAFPNYCFNNELALDFKYRQFDPQFFRYFYSQSFCLLTLGILYYKINTLKRSNPNSYMLVNVYLFLNMTYKMVYHLRILL